MVFTRRRRVYNAAVPSACFLLLLLLIAAFLLLSSRHHPAAAHHVLKAITPRASHPSPSHGKPQGNCQDLQSLDGVEARCAYIRSHTPCATAGYIDYLRLFYCGFGAGASPAVGYAAFLLWLLVLFYLLGDTASEYFCASLEGLSAALRLPPAVAGVTLLSLGNGSASSSPQLLRAPRPPIEDETVPREVEDVVGSSRTKRWPASGLPPSKSGGCGPPRRGGPASPASGWAREGARESAVAVEDHCSIPQMWMRHPGSGWTSIHRCPFG